jgi:pyridinium-3,5-bisthiocarboxylic acid mononucleotide nickel chelatase
MARTAHFDPFGGASGDMTVGALLDAGASIEVVRRMIASTGIEEVAVRSERAVRCGLAATRFVVEPAGHGQDHDHEHEGGHGHRGLRDILAMVERSELSSRGKGRVATAFRLLAEAEGRVHGQTTEEVHFHEVGAADSIADVVGAAAALEDLGVEAVSSGAPALGHDGFIDCAHGRLPIPAPAVVEILRGRAVKPGLSGVEQTTPTGAALLASLAPSFGPMPEMELEWIGCGAGGRDDPRVPNVLRVFVGRTSGASGGAEEGVLEIAATLDNLSGEVLGYLFERLPAEGALEVSLLPATLKKSRQGVHLVVLAPAARLDAVARAIFRETPTLGLRYRPVERLKLERSFVEAATRWGPVRIKCGRLGAELVTASPEYEDCRAIAAAQGVALREVQAEAMRAFGESQRAK